MTVSHDRRWRPRCITREVCQLALRRAPGALRRGSVELGSDATRPIWVGWPGSGLAGSAQLLPVN